MEESRKATLEELKAAILAQEGDKHLQKAQRQSTLEDLKNILHLLKVTKPNDRSETDRYHAIAITKMEEVVAHFAFWVVGGHFL